MKRVKYIFARHYEAIKLGMLVGLLVSNMFLISKVVDSAKRQTETTEAIQQQIAEDNKARQQTREENKKSDREFRLFICNVIKELLEAGNSQTSIEKLNSCVKNMEAGSTQTSSTSRQTETTEPKETQVNSPRKQATTSEPPEQPQEPSSSGLESTLNEVLALPGNLLKTLQEAL